MGDEGDNMTNPDDMTEKDFVWHDSYSEKDQIDSYENDTAEASNESYRKWFSTPMMVGAVGFSILVVLLIVVLSRSQNYAEKKQVLAIEKRLDRLEGVLLSARQSAARAPRSWQSQTLLVFLSPLTLKALRPMK
jgi:hypothetical protein